ncbi:glycosyltransferase family 2 protein [Microbacterium sp. cx-59]|uniref:glycosyltransferase family 2 protein n=1 Tax=Microbacterium sp. cx-59 TaxID=2891207 RepID=UPI001E596F9A|nr:galactosyltransferase-related protein [Microbacterium sp. cx-59]MCC4908050.1 glycosyltransferase family 2 protein [Microbacterium sp. cx-59]
MTRTAVITIAHGRHAHARRQADALALSIEPPDDRILVTMDDPALGALAHPGTHVLALAAAPEGLPLARARNAGAEAAIDRGAEVLIFLDVDCLPGPHLVGAYAAAATDPTTADRLLSGPVTYLPPAPPDGYDFGTLAALDRPHPARPAPGPGEVVHGGDPNLFWSLSFAVTAATWWRIGGFSERYVGYGGEDTDFGHTAHARGVEMAWVGSARAYHQHHAVESPPVRHVDAILRNGAIFAERWEWWPMTGWLDAFVALGLVARTPDGGYRRA